MKSTLAKSVIASYNRYVYKVSERWIFKFSSERKQRRFQVLPLNLTISNISVIVSFALFSIYKSVDKEGTIIIYKHDDKKLKLLKS